MVRRVLSSTSAIRRCPSCSAMEWIQRVKLAGYQNSTEYPWSTGFSHALSITQVISESDIPRLRPQPLRSLRAVLPPSHQKTSSDITLQREVTHLTYKQSSRLYTLMFEQKDFGPDICPCLTGSLTEYGFKIGSLFFCKINFVNYFWHENGLHL